MNLPIDASKPITRWKYLDEETPVFNSWYVFGEKETTVDIADPDGDVILNVPKDKAERILLARKAFVNAMRKELCG